MQIQRSPGGSLFPYYYKKGELFYLHYGSYFSDEESVLAIMKAEETFITDQHRSMGIWIDLSARVLTELVSMLADIRPQITRLGIAGCPWIFRRKTGREIKRSNILSSVPVRHFDDPEEAKTWLVSELA